MMNQYEVSIVNTFETESPEEAVKEMVFWLIEAATTAGYRVSDETGFVGFYDAEKMDIFG